MPEPLDATLRRLKLERDEADRRYNEALTALDQALGPPPDLPDPPAAYDEHQITPLNEAWNILPTPPAGTGLKGRLAGLLWRTVAPYFQRQLTFNSLLVDHLNRNVAAHRDARRSAERAIEGLREHMSREADIHSRLMFLLQHITPYVDTKGRETSVGALVLNGSLSALADATAKRHESAATRLSRVERRLEVRSAELEGRQADLQTSLAMSQLALTAVRRELERGLPGRAAAPDSSSPPLSPAPAVADEAFADRLDAYKYVGFEDQFRGSQAVIRERLESYLPFFDGSADVLDVGCGRGEFLDLLASRGIRARGIDLNPEMVEVCRRRGHDVTHADAAGYLQGLEDASLGGIFAAQVVEHLQPAYLLRVLDLASRKLKPGGTMVLETLNPACWVAFFESYIRDITHVWPLHPETLKFLVLASGFTSATLEYRSPVPAGDRLQSMVIPEGADPALTGAAETFNTNVDKLNQRLFTYLDYAVVGRTTAPVHPA